MKSYLLIFSSICLAGCMVSNGLQYEATSETNLYHIARVRKGMSEKQVLFIMHKPYSYESFQVDDDIYDVWFYVTRTTCLDQTRMVPQNLTPLTFKNGILVGTGYYWYYYAMKGEATETAEQNPVPPKRKTQSEEDTEFEKVLRGTPTEKSESQERPIPNGEGPAPTPPPLPNKVVPKAKPAPPPTTQNLSKVNLGMRETEVFSLMGDPINYRTFDMGEDTYDVWFYETIPSKTGKKSIIPQNITPLTFKNAELVSMTEEGYFDIKGEFDRIQEKKRALDHSENPIEESPIAKHSSLGSTTESSQISLGMSETEIYDLLGEPRRYETYQISEDLYDVWFYEPVKGAKGKLIPRPPLTFKNAILIGTGESDYSKVKKMADKDRLGSYDKQAERIQEEESEQNFNFW